MQRNPYHPRTSLSDVSWFRGRRSDLETLLSYLGGPNPLNVSLVGQRRIGKTWLLQRIAQDCELHSELICQPDTCVFVYWNLREEAWPLGATAEAIAERFFGRLLEQVLGRLPRVIASDCRDLLDPSDQAYAALRQALEYVTEELRVILLLDDFDGFTASTNLPDWFFGQLRALLGLEGVGSVVASYRSLQEAVRLSPDSPFFNIFVTQYLGLLDDEDARRFVKEPCASEGISVSPGALNKVLDLAGPHPCFLSQLGFRLVARASDGTVKCEDVEAQEQTFREAVSGDLAYYWEHLHEDEKALLDEVASGSSITSTTGPVYQRLCSLGLVRTRDGKPIPFSRAFSDYVRDSRAADVYFQSAFSDTTMASSAYRRVLEVMLTSANIPEDLHRAVSLAIRGIETRPQAAVFDCGRYVLEELLRSLFFAAGMSWKRVHDPEVSLFDRVESLDPAFEDGRLPARYKAHLHRVRMAGNVAAHEWDSVTPALAFLTVAETIYLADEVIGSYRR